MKTRKKPQTHALLAVCKRFFPAALYYALSPSLLSSSSSLPLLASSSMFAARCVFTRARPAAIRGAVASLSVLSPVPYRSGHASHIMFRPRKLVFVQACTCTARTGRPSQIFIHTDTNTTIECVIFCRMCVCCMCARFLHCTLRIRTQENYDCARHLCVCVSGYRRSLQGT